MIELKKSRRQPIGDEGMCRTTLGQGDTCFLVRKHYGDHAGVYDLPWEDPPYPSVKLIIEPSWEEA